MILFEDRAATVLYKVLITLDSSKKFLLPLNVCPIVPDTFVKANIPFEFIDINLDTLCMDQTLVLEYIETHSDIGGVLHVKTFGIDIDCEPFYQKIKALNDEIFIIDDMCPSIQDFNHNIEESYASLALFSSGYSKFVDVGYGGFGFLKNKDFHDLYDDKSSTSEFLTYKSLVEKEIGKMKEHKRLLNSIYRNGITSYMHLGEQFDKWRFSIMVDNKEEVLEEIFKVEGLFASSHYPQVDYNYKERVQENTNAQRVHSKIINLFNDFRFTADKASQIVDIVNKYAKKATYE